MDGNVNGVCGELCEALKRCIYGTSYPRSRSRKYFLTYPLKRLATWCFGCVQMRVNFLMGSSSQKNTWPPYWRHGGARTKNGEIGSRVNCTRCAANWGRPLC